VIDRLRCVRIARIYEPGIAHPGLGVVRRQNRPKRAAQQCRQRNAEARGLALRRAVFALGQADLCANHDNSISCGVIITWRGRSGGLSGETRLAPAHLASWFTPSEMSTALDLASPSSRTLRNRPTRSRSAPSRGVA